MIDQFRLEVCKKRIKEAKKIVFFGGAGVSTASGIPDFRSPQGLYNIKSFSPLGDESSSINKNSSPVNLLASSNGLARVAEDKINWG